MTTESESKEQAMRQEIIKGIVRNAENVSAQTFGKEAHESFLALKNEDKFSNWQEMEDAIDENNPIWRIEYGSKVVFIKKYKDEESQVDAFQTTVIQKVKEGKKPGDKKQPAEDEKLENETKLLYEVAKTIMQNAVNDSKKTAEYSFYSEDPKLIQWAMKYGNRIFEWETVCENQGAEDIKPFIACKKTFYPEE